MRSSGFLRIIAVACLLAATGLMIAAQAADHRGWQATRSASNAEPKSDFAHLGGWSEVREPEPKTHTTSFLPPMLADLPRRLVRPVSLFQPTPAPQPLTEFASGDAQPYLWQVLPSGLLFKSYMAGEKESRMGTALLAEIGGDTFQESVLGGRIGLLRYGTPGAIQPEGWQLDVEGAAFLRQNWTRDLDVDAVDFRIGVPLTWRQGPLAVKFGYYHISSHVGDEFLVRNPGFVRRNYVRDALLLGVAYNLTPDWMIYGEVAGSFRTDGGAKPWEFQFGTEYSPDIRNGFQGSPFFAINAHLREEFDFGGGLNVLAGWQWRSSDSDRVLRIGGQFYTGKSLQYAFFNRNEQLIGVGIWYDF